MMIHAALALALSLGLSQAPAAQHPTKASRPEERQKGSVVGESKSWKVEVVSAEYGLPGEEIPWDRGNRFAALDENECFLFLKLHFEYKGPSGDVPGPRVTLVNDKGERFSNSGNLKTEESLSLDIMKWYMSATHDDPKELSTLLLKTGDKFGNPWIEFLLVIPRGSKDLRLIFGGEEIADIALNATKAK